MTTVIFDDTDQILTTGNTLEHTSAGGFLFYENPTDQSLLVALIQQRDGKLYVPKGHLHKGEQPETAAVREVMEELSLVNKPKLIAKLGIDHYDFTLPGDSRKHIKYVHLYVMATSEHKTLRAPTTENIYRVCWMEFHQALNKMAFDRENLLRARKLYDSNKSIPPSKTVGLG